MKLKEISLWIGVVAGLLVIISTVIDLYLKMQK